MQKIRFEVFEKQAEIIRKQEEIIEELIGVLCQYEGVLGEENVNKIREILGKEELS